MTKLIVVTLDSCCRINPGTNEVLEPFRPSVVTLTEFVENLGLKRVIRGTVAPDEATDDEFLKFWNESGKDADLAVSSFLKSFSSVEDHEIAEAARMAAERQEEQRANAEASAAAQKKADDEAKAQDEANAKKAAEAAAQKKADEEAAKAAAAAAAKPAPAAPAKEVK